MATAAVPDGVVVGVAGGVADSSPSQERLTRIAAMLREADQGMPLTPARNRHQRRPRSEHRGRPAA